MGQQKAPALGRELMRVSAQRSLPVAVWHHTVLGHLDSDVLTPPQQFHHLVEVRLQYVGSLRLDTAKLHVLADRVPPSPLRELPIEGDENSTMVIGVAGQNIILIACEVGIIRRPPGVPLSAKHPADTDWDVIVQEKTQQKPPGG